MMVTLMIILWAINPNVVYGAGIVAAACIAAITSFFTARYTSPTEKRKQQSEAKAAELSAAEAAVHSVREALSEAQERIARLEHGVSELNRTIGQLQGQLESANERRTNLEERLELTLAEKAVLKQQVSDMELKLAGVQANEFGKPDAILMVDMVTGEIHYTSEGIYHLLGYTPKELIGQSIDMLVPEHLREIHAHERSGFQHHPRQRPMGTGILLLARKRNGIVIPVDISLHPTSDGRVLTLIKKRNDQNGQQDPQDPQDQNDRDPTSIPANGVSRGGCVAKSLVIH